MQKLSRKLIFFILIFLLFYLAVNLVQYSLSKNKSLNPNIIYLVIGFLFTIIVVGIFYLSKIESNEGFWDVSDCAKCKGGPYFWQGDSETSNMCRKLASTPEGRICISGYNCPVGHVGQPGLPFYYSPISNDNWENERCKKIPTCPGNDVGLCSLEKQLP